jgi:hypothetical protein
MTDKQKQIVDILEKHGFSKNTIKRNLFKENIYDAFKDDNISDIEYDVLKFGIKQYVKIQHQRYKDALPKNIYVYNP